MHRTASRDVQFPPDAASTARTRSTEVLLVTADAELREVGARVLGRAGYTVHVATHSGHAVLVGLTSRLDILIAELSAPDISGPALANHLRRHHPNLRAVFMANPGTPEGLEDVIVRPFTRDDLIARLHPSPFLDRRGPLHPG